MSISSRTTDGLSDAIRQLYADAEVILLERLARAASQGLDAPDWAERKLREVHLVNVWSRRIIEDLADKSDAEIAYALMTAANRGTAMAIADVRAIVDRVVNVQAHGMPPVERLLGETITAFRASHAAILRTVDDAYRQVIRESAGQILIGVQTRRDATQAALNRLADRGISGFVDKAGRRWDMASYAEMATRTASARAAVDAHLDRLVELGQDLVLVSNSPNECELCRPWESKVLSIGATLSRIDGAPVAGTVEQARAAGLLHPGCTHSLNAYLHGFTTIDPGPTANPKGYETAQRQRAIERKVRAWKRREAVAITDGDKAHATAKVRAWQAEARRHSSATGTKRLGYREAVVLGKPEKERVSVIHQGGFPPQPGGPNRLIHTQAHLGDVGRRRATPSGVTLQARGLVAPVGDPFVHYVTAERATAAWLETIGVKTRSVSIRNDMRTPDSWVEIDGGTLEIKHPSPTTSSVQGNVRLGRGQSSRLVLDMRGVTGERASQAMDEALRKYGRQLDVLIVPYGDGQAYLYWQRD